MSSPHGPITPPSARWRAAPSFLGAVTLISALLAGLASLGCGPILARKGPGEPCTRTTECRADLLCTAGVCMPGPDTGATPLDASTPPESGVQDADESDDGGLDASALGLDADGLEADDGAPGDADRRDMDDAEDATETADGGDTTDAGETDAP